VHRATEKTTLHDRIIQIVASANNETFEVHTNPSSNKNWFISEGEEKYFPDVILLPKGASRSTIIIEVETDESVNEEHAGDQWEPYARLGRKFYLLVPSGCLSNAKTICYWKGIGAHFGEYWWDGTRWAVRFED